MMRDYMLLALKNLKRRKLRTALAIIGIFVSVATIFMLISLSLGLQNAVEEQFKSLGTDKFFIQPGTGFLGPPGSVGGVILTDEDVRVIENVKGVRDVLPAVVGNARVEFNDNVRYMMVWGMKTETELYIEMGNYKIDEGRFIRKGESGIVLGNLHKTGNLFGREIRSGDSLSLNEEKFKVRGIIKKIGNPDDDRLIIMDIERFREFFNISERVDWSVIQVDEGEDLIKVAGDVEEELRKARGVTEKTQDFNILTPEELLGSFQDILNIVTAFLAGVAAISLLVGGIGIANTMFTSVLERTKDIGVMKAVGAKNKDIMMIFLIEAGLIGLVGGIVGVLLGIGVSKTVEFIAINQLETNLLKAYIGAPLIISCLAFSFLIGAFSGVVPALRASNLKPVDALRYE